MTYPPTRQYLTGKLNWLARKLKSMNDPPAIRDWTDAMLCVFKVHEAFLGNRDLTNPRQIVNRKLDFYKARSINILPLNKDQWVADKTQSNIKRPVIRGIRSRCSKSLINTRTGKEKRNRLWSSKITAEVSTVKVKKAVTGENVIDLNYRA